jgi:hypothetical protein
MKSIFVATMLLSASAFAGQGMQMPPPPKELSKASFFMGKWVGTEKVHGMGGSPVAAKGSMTGKKMLDNRYIQSMHTMDMGKAGKMEGMHLLSYDSMKKQFMAYWFDSSSPGVMEMSGNFQGNQLVMISKPTEIPGMPAPMVMRATWTKVSNSKLTFKLDSKDGAKWVPMIEGSYRKVG